MDMQEILNKIYKWTELAGLKLDQDESLGESFGIDFIGSVKSNDFGYNIAIFKSEELIKLSTYYRFNENTFNVISKFKDKGFEFLSDIQLALLQMNLNYAFLDKNNPSDTQVDIKDIEIENLESIEISKTIYFDGFNKNLYYDTIESIVHAAQVITLLFKKLDMKNLV
ncbi:DUF2299 domain-containing protein [Candidatus Nitrosocosmicus sp. SS]|jgi:hypothetical protein|nr:DUF2299 domain-containing protein [Candidatus Nitrosocosmicus sp. SS]KAF0868637.1 DUF2299 domain-containing protein [Candidatus Nitrosocosmicus sp. SS]